MPSSASPPNEQSTPFTQKKKISILKSGLNTQRRKINVKEEGSGEDRKKKAIFSALLLSVNKIAQKFLVRIHQFNKIT